MPVRSSAYFNNPAFAQAASNLGQLFAPPSGADAAGWAAADAKKAEAQRLQDFFDYQKDPNFDQQAFDRLGVAAGAYQPNQSYYSVDQGNATTRRGQDVTAATSRANNADDNVRALDQTKLSEIGKLYQPLSEGQVRPAVPGDIASMYDIPHAVEAAQGREKPLSETEFNARTIAGMSPEMQRAIAFGNTPVENVVTPEGPRIATRLDSVGQTPYDKPTAGMTTTLPDGTVISMGGSGAKPTEASDKAGIFYSRAAPASANMDASITGGYLPSDLDYEATLGSLSGLPNAASRHVISDEGRKFYSNAQNFMMSVLRPDTGAAFGKDEFQSYGRVFIPMPGDDAELLKTKSIARQTALAALQGTSRGAAEEISQILAAQGLPVPKEMAAVIARGGVGGGKAPIQAEPGPAQVAAPAPTGAPQPGTVEGGYRFKGGNPSDPANWEPAQ